MTAEPKFVPEEAVNIDLGGQAGCSVRLIDCVGYMVPGAMGDQEDGVPRMVMTPWSDTPMAMTEAAEIGTRKVIAEHSTIGVVVTTDGTVTDIPREDYLEAEERVISELQALGKPFVMLLNSAWPNAPETQELRQSLSEKYNVTCLAVNCLELSEEAVREIIRGVLLEFPLRELGLFLPAWVDALPYDHPIKEGLYTAIRESGASLKRVRDVPAALEAMGQCQWVSSTTLTSIALGSGTALAQVELPRSLFYETLSQRSGFPVKDDGDLIELLTQLSLIKAEYDKIGGALEQVKATGYGIVVPALEELTLEEPEIMKQGGRYGVRLRASAPSIHMIRADIQTEVTPIVGNEKQSEEMVNYLLQEFQGDEGKIWQSNIFGKSFHELVSEDLQSKLGRMPDDARFKLQETLQRIINEGSGGLICIIL